MSALASIVSPVALVGLPLASFGLPLAPTGLPPASVGTPLAVFGISQPVLGAALATAWLAILVATLYRYERGRIDRTELYATGGGSALWIGFGLLQASEAVSGRLATAIEVLFVLLAVAGFALFSQWWRIRDRDGTEGSDST